MTSIEIYCEFTISFRMIFLDYGVRKLNIDRKLSYRQRKIIKIFCYYQNNENYYDFCL